VRVVIIGGGKIGAYLTRELRSSGRSVIVVEQREDRARLLAEETGALAIHGDGTDMGLLTDLELRPFDLFIALTGRDEDNLVACQLARSAFGVRRVIARLNDPANSETFHALDIHPVSVTETIVRLITEELEPSQQARVALLGLGEISLLEAQVPEDVANRQILDLELPPSTVIALVRRDDDVFVPEGSTVIRAGDRLMAVTRIEHEDEFRSVVAGESSTGEDEEEPLPVESGDA
jgi:trk system potassium uptake protein TrkA